MDFKEQYKHPQWQKKRLEALQAAEYQCERCFDDESQLHVHHKRYVKGRKIWEYQISELSVLCESCHEEAHKEKDEFNDLLAALPPDGLSDVIGIAAGYSVHVCGPSGAKDSSFAEKQYLSGNVYSVLLGGLLAAIANRGTPAQYLNELRVLIDNADEYEPLPIVLPARNKSKFLLDYQEEK